MNGRTAAAEDGIRFFGRVTASISHEINNVLATIYENAGLVEDLLSAADRGRPLDANRIKDLASRVRTQVRRGRDIVENMNRFAHSVDEPGRCVELAELLALSTSLAQRTASMHEVVLEPVKGEGPVQVTTDPFLLQNLIWLCLDFMIQVGGSPNHIRLVPEAKGDEACIRFVGLRRKPLGTPFPTERLEMLSKTMRARLSMSDGEIILTVPKYPEEEGVSPQRDEATKKDMKK